jgi:quinone-modifying oxidoreductase subunit QmoC
MPDSQLLQPDRAFIDAVIAGGGEDLKKCFQCATCSVACGLSCDHAPFPRKEMHWAQWGLKDRLMADPDIWLCHQCNDCSNRCPRQARPGDVLAAVRRQAVEHYAIPRRVGSWVNSLRTLPIMLLIPAVLLAAALLVRDPLAAALGAGRPDGFYAEFFPHWLLISFFSLFVGLALLAAMVGVFRFWRAMKEADAASGLTTPVVGLLPSILRSLGSIFYHDRFRECETRRSRHWTHVLAFYGFLALFITTVWAVIDLYVNPMLGIASAYPFDLTHPMKFVANAGAVLLIVGAGKAIWDRTRSEATIENSTAFDWTFAWLLLTIGVTGLVIEILRFAAQPGASGGLETTAYTLYFIHLVLVFALLVYLPYSKFAHVLYRTVALVYAERTGRTRNGRLVAAPSGT